MGFTSFHLVYDIEVVLPIECEISTLQIIVELLLDAPLLKQHFLTMEYFDEECHISLQQNEAMKKRFKFHYDWKVHSCAFCEDDLILIFYTKKDTKLGPTKFVLPWRCPYIIKQCLPKGAYVLGSQEESFLDNSINGFYL